MNLSDVIKGALLHDIGKFIMRAKNQAGVTHQEAGAKWLEQHGVPGTVAEFAARHHRVKREDKKHDQLDVFTLPTNELLIVYEADNLSSGERPDKQGEGKWQADTPLTSVFSKISLDHRPGRPAYRNKWRYHKLDSAERLSFPGERPAAGASYGAGGYSNLLSRFEADFARIAPDFNVDALLVLLEKYTSYIPSETRVVEGKPESSPDVSLFDHLKTTAAIATCLYKYMVETCANFREDLLKDHLLDRQDLRYMLVGGDFSGVQKFIYTISSKGALKTLRARSFILELLTEHVIAGLLEKMGLTRANVVYAGGGRFYLLAPNTKSCREALGQTSLELNKTLYETYRGRLYLALEKVEFAGEAFIPGSTSGWDIARLWGELRSRLNQKKNHKFAEMISLDPDGFWSPAESTEKTCAVCHADSARLTELHRPEAEETVVEVCPGCKQLYELGDKLPGTKYIAGLKEIPDKLPFLKIGDLCYVFCSGMEDLKSISAGVVYVLNSWDINDYVFPGAVQMFTGSYAVRQSSRYKGFDQLAAESLGAPRIGVLRMDVDNLGTIFTRGLPENARTFSRLSTLSRSLTHFFKYHINEVCRGRHDSFTPFRLIPRGSDRNATLVYAGGDDLFLVGSWDDVTELAFDVAACFKSYTGANPDVTISGGVVVQDPKYPLYKLAEIAGEAEERAKDNGRDSISLFYSPVPEFFRDGSPLYTGTFKWREANQLIEEILVPAVSSLAEIKDSGARVQFQFSKGFMHRLAAVADIWRREGKLYLPRLAYTLAREGERKDLKNSGQWNEWKQKLYNIQIIAYLRTAVTWMDLLSRRGAEVSHDEKSMGR